MSGMHLERFEHLVDAYGPDLIDWPVEDRAAAETLLRDSREAQDLVHSARQLNAALDDYQVAAPSPDFESMLLDMSPPAPRREVRKSRGFTWAGLRFLTSASAALACAAFGLVVGFSVQDAPAETVTSDEADAFVSVAFSSYDETFWKGEEG